MKYIKPSFLFVCLIVFVHECFSYTNPVIESSRCDRDPDCMKIDGCYYLLSPYENGYKMFTSLDLVNWNYQGVVFTRDEGDDVWQGYIHKSGPHEFFLYYTAINDGEKHLSVARSSSPFGPWEDLGRLIHKRTGIDPFLYEDDDGQLYLYYKWPADGEKSIYVQKMSDPITPEEGDKEILRPIEGSWEEGGDFLSLEGPSVVKIGDKYCLFVAGGAWAHKRYAVGYALSDQPMGPFVRAPHNPIISWEENPEIFAPGVANAIKDAGGDYWLVYRQKVNDRHMDKPRFVAIDRLDVQYSPELHIESYGTRGIEVDENPSDSLVALGEFHLESLSGTTLKTQINSGRIEAVFTVCKVENHRGYQLQVSRELKTDRSIDFKQARFDFDLCHYANGKHYFRIRDLVTGRYVCYEASNAKLCTTEDINKSGLFSVLPVKS